MSRKRHVNLERLYNTGIVGVLRGVPAEQTVEVAQALVDGGVDVIEVTADTDGALDTIARLDDAFDRSEALIGAGTVLDGDTAGAALRAGASFVVTPSFNEEVVRTCNRYGVVVAPGVLTPTEAVTAYEAGADVLKIFPASTVGPGHIRSIKGPLEQLPIIPTGGVSLENVEAFIDAGADAVGVGGALVDSDAVAGENYEALTERAAAFRDAIDDAR